MSFKDGNNSIIIVGGTNIHYESDMKDLDPSWHEAIVNSKVLLL